MRGVGGVGGTRVSTEAEAGRQSWAWRGVVTRQAQVDGVGVERCGERGMPWDMAWASAEVRRASAWLQRWGGRQGTGVGGRGVTSYSGLKTQSRHFGDKGLGIAATIFVRLWKAVARIWITGVIVEVFVPGEGSV